MKDEKFKTIVVVGAGNVGLATILNLALILQQTGNDRWRIHIVDFDRVEKRDIRKGYFPSLVGEYKAGAAVNQVRTLYGFEIARHFNPLAAAVQSLPGLLREADVVFNGTDSKLSAAYVSEQARNQLEIRMSTGIFGDQAVHSVEVLPPGFTLGEDSYDAAAWADTSRRQCLVDIPQNASAGVAQPFGAVTGSIGANVMLARKRNEIQRPYIIQVIGERITQSYGSGGANAQCKISRELPVGYDEKLISLFQKTAQVLGTKPADILLAFPTPVVMRQCLESSEHGIYRGFELQPATGKCNVCGAGAFCLSSPREICLDDVAAIANKGLNELNTPAGIGFTAWSKSGQSTHFHLPFHFNDVPQLIDDEIN
jgi:molybdopterin/thiamine biosynthesis adenylyltransferase